MIINGTPINAGENLTVPMGTYYLPTGTKMEVPVHVFRSAKQGPTVLLMAGMHGDEINGIEILRLLINGQRLKKLKRGSVLVIPIVNVIAFLNGTRELPDGRDLNRCFPGSVRGSLGSRVAYDLIEKILPQVDFGVDFHTGGRVINNYPQLRCSFRNNRSLVIARAFSPPLVVNSAYREKSLRKEAADRGKPILVYESGESNRFSEIGIKEGLDGCYRLLKKFHMIDTAPRSRKPVAVSSSKWMRAKISGLFRTSKKFGTYVKKGQVIGTVTSPYAEIEKQIISPINGYILGINNKPVVNEGDALMHIGLE